VWKKVGQTSEKIKHILRQMNKEKQSEQPLHTMNIENREVNEGKVESLQYKRTSDEQVFSGELPSAVILAKIGKEEQVVSQKQIIDNKLAVAEPTKMVKTKQKQSNTMSDFIYEEQRKSKKQEQASLKKQQQMSEEALTLQMKEIQKDLKEALEHWKWTKHAYNHAIGFEQVEYCIYQMMAAEQKYRMILLKARSLEVDWSKLKGDMV